MRPLRVQPANFSPGIPKEQTPVFHKCENHWLLSSQQCHLNFRFNLSPAHCSIYMIDTHRQRPLTKISLFLPVKSRPKTSLIVPIKFQERWKLPEGKSLSQFFLHKLGLFLLLQHILAHISRIWLPTLNFGIRAYHPALDPLLCYQDLVMTGMVEKNVLPQIIITS